MSFADWIIIALLVLWAAAAVRYMIKRKKSGKCVGCSGNCANCHKVIIEKNAPRNENH